MNAPDVLPNTIDFPAVRAAFPDGIPDGVNSGMRRCGWEYRDGAWRRPAAPEGWPAYADGSNPGLAFPAVVTP